MQNIKIQKFQKMYIIYNKKYSVIPKQWLQHQNKPGAPLNFFTVYHDLNIVTR